tara:strand:- start:92651 stop:93334 length:684 start_codon:yes stop_codon:yes gene_type:complete
LVNEQSDFEVFDALKDAKKDGYQLIYLAASQRHALPLAAARNELQSFHIVDQVHWSKNGIKRQSCVKLPDGYEISKYADRVPDSELFALAKQAGHSSRFRLDSHFGEMAFEQLYRTWIERSCSGDFADVVHVVRDGHQKAVALITLGQDHRRCSIGLIAVSQEHRRRGLANALLESAQNWAFSQHCETLSVVTQSSNETAMKLYDRFGFEINETVSIYHFWLDEIEF